MKNGIDVIEDSESGRKLTYFKNGNRSTASSEVPTSASLKLDESKAGSYDTAECPVGREVLGRHTWTFLHTLAAHSVPDKPTAPEQKELADFMTLMGRYYPCSLCAGHLQEHMKKHPPEVETREAFAQWMCHMHNDVNARLDKPKFDCSRVDERWREGWKDGHCDD